MSFKINQRVRMKRTEHFGVVTQLLPDGIIQVLFDGGMGHLEIPKEALEAAEVMPPPKPVATPAPAAQVNNMEEETPGGGGVQLAFDTQLNNMAEPVAYEVYLLNSTPYKIIFELKVLTGSNRRWSKAGQIEAGGKKRLDAVPYEWLNEKLICELDVRAILQGGTGPRHFQQLRIKGSTFFTKYMDVPELYRDAHLYVVFPVLDARPPAPASAPKSPSLKAITAAELSKKPKPVQKNMAITDLAKKLEFVSVIDLHLEELVKDPASVPKHQVLQTQLKHFDEYMDQALRLGVDKVTIIHGVGNGVLKRAVHSRLHGMRFVRDFTNEYQAKYGYGATEVYFD